MKNKILSIVVFAVAILDCLLALFFSFSFNEEKKDNYIKLEQFRNNALH